MKVIRAGRGPEMRRVDKQIQGGVQQGKVCEKSHKLSAERPIVNGPLFRYDKSFSVQAFGRDEDVSPPRLGSRSTRFGVEHG